MKTHFSIEDKELRKISKELMKCGDDTHKEGKRINKDYAKKILKQSINNAPYITRNLQQSITSKTYKGGEIIKIYTRSTAPYAVWVHEGHWTRGGKGGFKFKRKKRFIKAQPFMYDALQEYRGDYINAMKNILRK